MDNNLIDKARELYHTSGDKIIPDEVYDTLVSDDEVGSPGKVDLPVPMYSLEKSYTGIPKRFLGRDLVTTPKLDGAAIELVYIDGTLMSAYTRGDGIKGRDITAHILTMCEYSEDITHIPYTIPMQGKIVLTGEAVSTKVDNTRNYVTGSLATLVPDLDKLKNIKFAAYDIFDVDSEYPWSVPYTEMMGLICSWGFKSVTSFWDDNYPKDGEVVRLNSYQEYYAEGFTSKHPKGAIALKVRKQGVVTKLLDVTWQVGRTGVVTPVAILEPVVIDGANISRASLHNKKFIQELGLDIGDLVEVIRAGDIIPQILRKAVPLQI